MSTPLIEEHPHLLHKVGTRNRPSALGIHLADRNDACLNLICPGSENVTQLSRACLQRDTGWATGSVGAQVANQAVAQPAPHDSGNT